MSIHQNTKSNRFANYIANSTDKSWKIWAGSYLILTGIFQLLGDRGWFNMYYAHILTVIGINIILVASLNVINGYLGEFALGHAGFIGIGAYSAALIAIHFQLPWYLGLPLSLGGGMIVAGAIGYLIGLITFKTVGDYLAIITLGFNAIIVNVIQNIDFIGGPRGLTGIPKNINLFVVSLCLVLTYHLLIRLINSGYGRTWIAIRENDIAAELMGVNISRAKNLAFTIAAAFAGLAGGLLAQYQQYITPTSFNYIKTTELLVMLYLGGMGSLSGSILGVVAYTLLMELIRNVFSFDSRLVELRFVISPLILIIIMLTRQFGLMGNKEWRWLRMREEDIGDDNDRIGHPTSL